MKIDYTFYWREFSWKMYDIATILFDDTKNDLRSLPKTVRFQILTTLSAVWSVAFSLLVFETIYEISYGWGGLMLGHVAIIVAAYVTFHAFKDVKEKHSKIGHTVGSWDECIDYLEKKDG
jgi:hypothetical protein